MAPSKTFLDLPDHLPPQQRLRAVIFGAGRGTTYRSGDSSGHALGADTIRAGSQEDAALVEN